ncbi:MAG: hypothetical protein K2J77_04745 [Oscillospiraceae bacterium]|nr:hypothetical protein [Oscillospiraceae bacterium]
MKSILIADEPGGSFGLPWKGDAPCFNFNVPRENIPADELPKIADKSEITTLVLGVDLQDYSVVSEFSELTQLYIYSGEKLTDISFIKPLVKLHQLYIAKSHISSLEPLEELIREKARLLLENKDNTNAFFTYYIEALCISSDSLNCTTREFKERFKDKYPEYNWVDGRDFFFRSNSNS